jgi:hypothetical protein
LTEAEERALEEMAREMARRLDQCIAAELGFPQQVSYLRTSLKGCGWALGKKPAEGQK